GNVGVGQSLTVTSAASFSTLGEGIVQSNSLGGLSSGPVNLGSATFVSGILPIANGGTNNSTYTSGGVIFYDGTRLNDLAAQFYFDSVNRRVGIGTSSPLTLLQVGSDAQNGLFVLNTGNVGINTTSPDYDLRVNGTGYFSSFVGIGSSLSVSGNVGVGQSLSVSSASVLDSLSVTKSISTATLGTTGNVAVGGSLTTSSAAHLSSLNVSGVSSLTNTGITGTLSVSGNVGVGQSLTVSQTGAFTLAGQDCSGLNNLGKLTTDASGNVYCADDLGGGGLSGGIAGAVTFWTSSTAVSANTNFLWDTANMRLGIGSSASGNTLGVFGSVGIGVSYAGAFLPTSLANGLAVQGNVAIGTTQAGGALVVMNGNVGFGTTSPVGQLHVVGECVAEGTRIRRRRKKTPDLGDGDDEYEITTESGKVIRVSARTLLEVVL
ncbi:MAG: hypothetical protein Q8P92_00820, partial [Candidatus Daviesbacteria bacterium]|nr:hypothetical protein [Candidatus Daviesbacteria bacterium]